MGKCEVCVFKLKKNAQLISRIQNKCAISSALGTVWVFTHWIHTIQIIMDLWTFDRADTSHNLSRQWDCTTNKNKTNPNEYIKSIEYVNVSTRKIDREGKIKTTTKKKRTHSVFKLSHVLNGKIAMFIFVVSVINEFHSDGLALLFNNKKGTTKWKEFDLFGRFCKNCLH